jgi:hypothetical protein
VTGVVLPWGEIGSSLFFGHFHTSLFHPDFFSMVTLISWSSFYWAFFPPPQINDHTITSNISEYKEVSLIWYVTPCDHWLVVVLRSPGNWYIITIFSPCSLKLFFSRHFKISLLHHKKPYIFLFSTSTTIKKLQWACLTWYQTKFPNAILDQPF